MSEVKVIESIDPDCRKFKNSALNAVLKTGSAVEVFDAYLLSRDDSKTTEELLPIGKKILENLKRIPGIATIFLRNGEIVIIKGLAFDWECIEPQVICILETLSDNPDAECSFENRKASPKCKVEIFPSNDYMRGYHFNMIVLSNLWESIDEMSASTKQAIKRLQASPMIKGVTFRRHSIFINKDPSPDWEEVDKILKPIFEKLFGASVEIEYLREDIDIIVFCENHDGLDILDIIAIFKSNHEKKPRLSNN